jgi:hypothetical protein
MTYITTKSFNYPKDLVVRNAIRLWHRSPKNDGTPYSRDRGEQVEVAAGSTIMDPPIDLLESWLQAGLIVEEGR